MSYLEALDRPIAYHRVFASIAGSVAGAVYLSQLVYWNRKMGGEFYKSVESWTEETGLTRYEQESARRNLKKLGVLAIKRKGVPARLHYLLDIDALEGAIAQFVESSKQESGKQQASSLDPASKSAETSEQVCGETANKFVENSQTITESKQRLPEIKQESGDATPTPPKKKASARKPAKKTFPEDFTVTDEMREWFVDKGYRPENLESDTEQWANAMMAKGEVRADWVAAWRNGMGFAHKWRAEREAKQVAGSQATSVAPARTKDTTISEQLSDRSWAR